MFKWFMTKTLITKIIIVTSSVIVIGGTTAGAIIVPKVIETKKEEQRQEQIRLENEEDLANINITLSREKIEIPLNGVTQGITIERYPQLEAVIPVKVGDEIKKEELDKILIEMFVENYTGGDLTVDIDPNINSSTRGEYPITFTVKSEKGNTKIANAILAVCNYFRPDIYIDKTEITINKGTNVDIMEGVTFDSNLPKEEQGHIETTGTVDINTVGTYTITYKYIPKEGTGENSLVENATRTYKVIEKTNVKLNTTYYNSQFDTDSRLVFTSNSTFTNNIYININGTNKLSSSETGTYTVDGNKIVLKYSYDLTKNIIINNSNNTWILDPQYHYDTDGV